MTQHVAVTREGAVTVLTLDRADKKNALTGAMYEALIAALQQAETDEAIGAVMVTGAGGSFSAGNDIGDFVAHAMSGVEMPAFRFVKAIAAFDKPLVAAVEGAAVGVGTTMLFHCDLVYAAPSAKLRMPFIDLGLVPEAGSSLSVPLRFGHAKAAELLMLGEALELDEARRLGLVNDIVPAGELHAHALDRAKRLAAKPRAAMRATRRLLRGDRGPMMARIDEEARAFATAMRSPEAAAAFATFLGKSASR